jgi:uncharacterized membrane protein YfcA
MSPAKRKKLLLEFVGAYLVATALYLVTRYREKGAIDVSDFRALALCLVVGIFVVAAVAAFIRLLAPPKQDGSEGTKK